MSTYTAKVGSVRVQVVRDGTSHGKTRYCIAWRPAPGAPRKRERFTDKKRAQNRAFEIANAIASSQADNLTLSSADVADYRRACQMLAPFNIPLGTAMAEFVSARKKVHPHTLHEAVTFFSRGHAEHREAPPVAGILVELLAELADERRSDKYVTPLRRDLEKFAAAIPDINEATEENVRAYLRDLRTSKGGPVSARRRDNVRDSIVRLTKFARKKSYLAADKVSGPEHIGHVAEGGEVSTYAPAEVAGILSWFHDHAPAWLPLVAIGAFAGLRTSEIFRLSWEAFNWTEGCIAVPRAIARKVRKARSVPILPALAAWLSPWRQHTGPLFPDIANPKQPRPMVAVERARDRVWLHFKKDTGVVWKTNALRHSFGSHRLAAVKSYDQVALEMGNSPAQIREHYNDPKGEAEALRYFSIVPASDVKNVVSMTSGA
jgi:integrase